MVNMDVKSGNAGKVQKKEKQGRKDMKERKYFKTHFHFFFTWLKIDKGRRTMRDGKGKRFIL